jgi:lipopolysaccharide export LptBFGC system permease protein LptF
MDRLPIPLEIETGSPQETDLDGMRLWQLWDYAAATRAEPRRRDALTRFHVRIAGSLAPFPLLFLAAGIGMTVRRSSRLAGLGATLPSLILLYGCRYLFADLSESGTLPPNVGPYLGPALIGVAALAVIYVRCRG